VTAPSAGLGLSQRDEIVCDAVRVGLVLQRSAAEQPASAAS
jgi:hypothetical protein